MRRPSGDREIPDLTISMVFMWVSSRSSKKTDPPAFGICPMMARRVDDLPAPFAPIKVTILLSSISSVIPRTALMPP